MSANDRSPKILFGALALMLSIGALLGGGMMGPGVMGPGMMWGYGGTQLTGPGWMWGLTMGLGMLLMLAFWVAVILGVVLLVRWAIGTTSRAPDEPRSEHPLDILRRRYAAGEIDQATYQRMQRELEGGAENRSRETVAANGREN